MSVFDVPGIPMRMRPHSNATILLLFLLASRAFGQTSFEEYLSTNVFVQHIAFESRVEGQAPALYEASSQPEASFFRVLNTNGLLEVTGTSEKRLWHVRGELVIIADIPSPNTPIHKLEGGQLEFASKKQILGTALSFGFQSAEVGTFRWNGDSFTATPRKTDHEPVERGTVAGRVTAREGGRITSLFCVSSVLPDVTNYVRLTYSDSFHPFLPSVVAVEFFMEGQRYAYETRYTSVLLGLTNTPPGGYVPSMWLKTSAKNVLLFTNGAMYDLNHGKPIRIQTHPTAPSISLGEWVTPGAVAWSIGILTVILAIVLKMRGK